MSFKKMFKLLCCTFIAIFIFGICGEKVLADDANITITYSDNENERWWIKDPLGLHNSVVKKTTTGSYAFCLDSDMPIYKDTVMNRVDSLSGSYVAGYKERISRIITNAYRMGLGNGQASHSIEVDTAQGKKTFNVSEKDLYGIVQSAVWSVAHGEGANGFSDAFKKWINERDGFSDILSALINGSNEKYYASIEKNTSSQDSTDSDYYYSYEYLVQSNLPSGVTYKLWTDATSVKVNNGEWKTATESAPINVNVGDKIVFRNSLSESSEVNTSKFYLQTSEYIVDYSASLYVPNNGIVAQNIVVGFPNKSSQKLDYSYSYNVSVEKELTVYKVATNDLNKKLDGAKLRLYIPSDTDDKTVKSIISDFVSKPNGVKFKVSPGKYCVKELSAPEGYVLSDDVKCTTVTSESTGNDLVLTLKNDKVNIKFRKVDASGKPVAGVELKIRNYVYKQGQLDDMYVCAITDENGYLTKPCSETNDYYNSTGVYELQGTSSIYFIQEKFPNGTYNPAFDENDDTYDFGVSSSQFFVPNNLVSYIYLDGNLGIDPVVTVSIVNDKSIQISKTDTGSGKEIPGAEMHLYDAEAIGTSLTEQELLVEVDSWISDGTPHTFIGIVPNREYVLSETVAPEGYVRIKTDIRFKMDEEGNVTVLSNQQGVYGDTDNAYRLVVGNDFLTVPKTGISILNLIAVGGFMIFVGYEVIKIYRKKVNS